MAAGITCILRTGIYESCPHCRAIVEIVYATESDQCVGAAHHSGFSYLDDSLPWSSDSKRVCRIFRFEDFRTEEFRDRWKTMQELMK